MTRIALCADVHLGNHRAQGGPITLGMNERCHLGLSVLRGALGVAFDHGCEEFVILGDLFDNDRPVPQLIRAVQDSFAAYELRVVVLRGNHDLRSVEPLDNAISPLAQHATTIECPSVLRVGGKVDMLLVPFVPGPVAEWLPQELALLQQYRKPGRRSILGMHAGISDDETAPYLRGASDSIDVTVLENLCKQFGISAAFAGHWHNHVVWQGDGVEIVQLGALVPTGWDDPGLDGYGQLAIYDTDANTIELVEISGPRFVAATSLQDAEKLINRAFFNDEHKQYRLFVRLTVGLAEMPAALAWRDTVSNEAKVEVLPDATEAKVAARAGAMAAKSSDTLDAAVAAFVEQLNLAESVDRSRVLERTRFFLTEGGKANAR